ncbi:MAG: YiiD C-terminal domain-containing protein [Panacagrimonas sp.]
MTLAQINAYLHAHIPLSQHMGMRVLALEPGRVRVHLPLAPNINPHGTLFGGALAALGLASGWILLHAAFERAGVAAKLVGQRSDCTFIAPATADCIAETGCAPADLDRLLASFVERGRARMTLETLIRVGQQDVVRHSGTYVALQETISA